MSNQLFHTTDVSSFGSSSHHFLAGQLKSRGAYSTEPFSKEESMRVRYKKKVWISISLIFFVLLQGMDRVWGEIFVVSPGEGGIQRAIGEARPGDVIKVRPGRYRESLMLKSGITLEGGGRDQVEITFQDGNTLWGKNIKDVKIIGVSLVAGGNRPFAAVKLEEAQGVTFTDCLIKGGALSGIEVEDSNNVSIDKCVISGNGGAGVLIVDSSNVHLTDNQTEGNEFQGIAIQRSIDIVASGNVILRNDAAGMFIADNSEVVIKKNLILHNRISGIEIENAEGEVTNNTIIENKVAAIRLSDHSRGSIIQNIVASNDFGIVLGLGSRAIFGYNNVYQNRTYNYARTGPQTAKSFPVSEDRSLSSSTDISVDPYFVDERRGDYFLFVDSPLAGRGRNGGHIGAFPPRADTQSIVDIIPEPGLVRENKNAFALVIGISRYREKAIPGIKFASHDAKIMAKYLEKVRGIPRKNIKVLIDEEATKGDFEAYFEEWLPRRVKKDSTVFVYYAGHGTPDPKTQEAFLVPYDGHPDFTRKLYPLKRVYAALNTLSSKEIIVMLDSCFSGAGGRSIIQVGARPMGITLEDPLLAGGKVIVFAAAAGSQVSSDYEKVKHGLFTYFLLKGMGGEAGLSDTNRNGEVSLEELSRYVAVQVSEVAIRDLNREQTPVLRPALEFLGDRSHFPLVHR